MRPSAERRLSASGEGEGGGGAARRQEDGGDDTASSSSSTAEHHHHHQQQEVSPVLVDRRSRRQHTAALVAHPKAERHFDSPTSFRCQPCAALSESTSPS